MITLRNCRMVDIRNGTYREGSVTVQEDRIEEMEPSSSAAESCDLEGAYLLPGLISCHTHLSIVFPFSQTDENESPAVTALRCYRRGMDALQNGITTVRTVAELHRADIALREMIRKKWVQGPRIFSAGRSISVTGGHGSGFGSLRADSPDEFRRCAREEIRAGANHIKIFISGGIAHQKEAFDEPQMTLEEMQAVVEAARSKGTYVCAHSSGALPIQRALEAGVRCFEHGYHLDRDTARKMKEAGAFLVPTLSVTRSENWMREHGFAEWTIEKALSAGSIHRESIRAAIAEGVRLVNGTDIPPGDTDDGVTIAVKEMEHLVEAGLSPLQALQASTLTAAELLEEDGLGRIEPDCYADFVAVRNDPLADISAMRSIFFVMQAGKIIRWDRS